ncbi:MAG: glycosyltransferase family 2 protein [Erysipelotrichaceae bacterium]|nr:glycosyltransferase family 2 protein [Erysipelotrichaceae bacterium]
MNQESIRKDYTKQPGVPGFFSMEFRPKQNDYVVLIPIINKGQRILTELRRMQEAGIQQMADIVLLDGGSTDGSTEEKTLKELGVNTVLVIQDEGRQGAGFRMGFYWSFLRDYEGILTVDGNNKDSVEDIPKFIEKLKEGYDFIQGSRFHPDGKEIRTPLFRKISVRYIHAPIISAIAGVRFTDTTNAFRAHSKKYLTDPRVQPLRDIFMGYELLDYLSVRASRIGLRSTEIGVTRTYPENGEVPTKIRIGSDHVKLLMDLVRTATGYYNPKENQ